MGGQTVTWTFDVNQEIFALAIMGAYALLGAGLIIYGALLITRRLEESRWLPRATMTRDLDAWNSGITQTTQQRDLILRQLTVSLGWEAFGGGMGLLLATVGVCVVALGLTGALSSLIAGGASVLAILQFQGVALGMTLGFLIGSWRATHRIPTLRPYADLRRRRPSDYRAWWVAWAPALSALCAVGPLWLLATQTPHVTFTLGAQRWLFPTAPVVGALHGAGVLIPVVATLCVRWLVASPRTLLAADPEAARGADDYRRALGIGSILGWAWMSSGNLLQSVMMIATASGVGREQPIVAPLLTAIYFLGTASFLAGIGVIALHGRLGGRLTKRSQRNAAAGRAGELVHE